MAAKSAPKRSKASASAPAQVMMRCLGSPTAVTAIILALGEGEHGAAGDDTPHFSIEGMYSG